MESSGSRIATNCTCIAGQCNVHPGTLVSTASLTGARIFRTDDGAYYAVCSCGQRSPDHYVTDIDAQRWAGKHWTAKPYCDAPQRPERTTLTA
jgi:hypothetical protein